jgi:hypothetical protein
MLGKAEYVKYVLNSVCRERARIFVSDKFLGEPALMKQLSNSDVESFLDEKELVSRIYLRNSHPSLEICIGLPLLFQTT